ncbi:MAG: AEC family transporter [Pseudomonadales bacterium]
MLQEVLGVVTPVFAIAGIGYIWMRRGQAFDNETVGNLVMYIGSPCLIYSSLTAHAPSLDALAIMASAAVVIIALNVCIAYAFLKLMRWPVPSFLPALVQPNGGNMGLPVALLAFGETGLALAMAYFFVNSVSQYTLGLAVSSGHFSVTQLLKQPVIWSVLVVLVVLSTDLAVPQWINDTTTLLGGLTIPIMLLMLGTSLARLRISDVRQTSTIALLRLGIGLGLGLLVIRWFELEGTSAGIVLLQATMPSAVFNYVFAERYDRDPEKVAAVIVQSTLLSVLVLPLLVAWAMKL